MAIPSQTEMFSFVLGLFDDGQQYTRKEMANKAAERLGLTIQEREAKTSSGKPVYESRVAWAISYLSRANLLLRVKRGVYQISDRGLSLLGEKLNENDFAGRLQQIIANENPWGVQGGQSDNSTLAEESYELKESSVSTPQEKSPVETIEDAVSDLNDSLSQELLDNIMNQDPAFFENLVVDLLERMGYGIGSATQLSHDGGIDGIITTDTLGFDPIYTQAKRYNPSNKVGRPEMQGFAGALGRVDRGVFITTSSFNQAAIEFAKSYPHATIVLIDGKRLTDLMIKYDVGVSTERSFVVKRIDIDYFESDV